MGQCLHRGATAVLGHTPERARRQNSSSERPNHRRVKGCRIQPSVETIASPKEMSLLSGLKGFY